MNCQQYRREIDAADAGARPSGRGPAEHADSCAACRRFADERARLRALVSELEPVGAPPDFEFKLKARLAAEKRRGRRAWLPARFAPGAAAVALAALFVLGVGLALRRQTSDATGASVAVSAGDTHAETSARPPVNPPRSIDAAGGGAESSANDSTRQRMGGGQDGRHERRRARRTPNADAPRTSDAPRQLRAPALSGATARATNSAPSLVTTESAFSAAQSFVVGEPIPMPVNPSAQSLRVVFLDERGASRVVAVKPVSFGAEEFAGQSDGPRRAARTTKEGVW